MNKLYDVIRDINTTIYDDVIREIKLKLYSGAKTPTSIVYMHKVGDDLYLWNTKIVCKNPKDIGFVSYVLGSRNTKYELLSYIKELREQCEEVGVIITGEIKHEQLKSQNN